MLNNVRENVIEGVEMKMSNRLSLLSVVLVMPVLYVSAAPNVPPITVTNIDTDPHSSLPAPGVPQVSRTPRPPIPETITIPAAGHTTAYETETTVEPKKSCCKDGCTTCCFECGFLAVLCDWLCHGSKEKNEDSWSK